MQENEKELNAEGLEEQSQAEETAQKNADQTSEEQSQETPHAESEHSQEVRIIPIEKLDMKRLMQLEACTRCGECLKWCPVYEQDEREEVIPRAKIQDFLDIVKSQHSLLGRLLQGDKDSGAIKKAFRRMLRIKDITDDMLHAFAHSLYECSTCGQCQIVCPAGIDTVELWEDIRQLLVTAGYGPLDNHKVLVKSVKSYDNPWQQPRQGRTKWARSAKKKNLIDDTPKEIKKSQANILLFFGCTAVYDVNVQQIAINTVNILESLGINYGCLGGAEKCCGSVLLRVGDPEFERIALDNIQEFNKLGIDTLVTSCSGCFKTIMEDYPKVADLNFEVLHTVEFLRRLLEDGQLKFTKPVKRKVTYHDPCHLGRATGVYDAPRTIMKAIPGLEVIEMERIREYSRCCGAGGGVKAGFPDIQEKISLRRIKEAEATGATELISACPFCFAGLQVGIKAMGSNLVMKDVTSLVAESLGCDVEAKKEAAEKEKAAKEKEKAKKAKTKEKGSTTKKAKTSEQTEEAATSEEANE
jgi:heterodisulfide reductase subunit D